MAYDYTDPDIFLMVVSTHRPIELPAAVVDEPVPGQAVKPIPLVCVCGADHEAWPCAAITGARAYRKEQAATPAPGQFPPTVPVPREKGGSVQNLKGMTSAQIYEQRLKEGRLE